MITSFLFFIGSTIVNIEEWLKDLLCHFIAGLRMLGGSPSIPGASSYFARETRKTLALMKDIEAELEERSDPTRAAIPWGYTTREVADGLALIASAGMISLKSGERTDEIYEEPVASYPTEMRI